MVIEQSCSDDNVPTEVGPRGTEGTEGRGDRAPRAQGRQRAAQRLDQPRARHRLWHRPRQRREHLPPVLPAPPQAYGPAEAGCAIARWVAGARDVTASRPPTSAQRSPASAPPGTADAMMAAYDAESAPSTTRSRLASRRPVPHRARDAFRMGKRCRLACFSPPGRHRRLGVPRRSRQGSDHLVRPDIRMADPPVASNNRSSSLGAVGAKFKCFLGKDERQAAALRRRFAGSATRPARDMGFANDRNGNSVPDDLEVGADTDLQRVGLLPGLALHQRLRRTGRPRERQPIALSRHTTADNADRIDVVRIGPVFLARWSASTTRSPSTSRCSAS